MKRVTLALISAAMLTAGAAFGNAADPTGVWRMESGKVTVKVADCGGKLCGKVVGLKKPLNKQGQPKTDKENPNPALRKRAVIGITLMSNMKPDGANKWTGLIYNPDDGRTYSATMKLDGDRMKVKGCVIGLICQSKWFVRVE